MKKNKSAPEAGDKVKDTAKLFRAIAILVLVGILQPVLGYACMWASAVLVYLLAPRSDGSEMVALGGSGLYIVLAALQVYLEWKKRLFSRFVK